MKLILLVDGIEIIFDDVDQDLFIKKNFIHNHC